MSSGAIALDLTRPRARSVCCSWAVPATSLRPISGNLICFAAPPTLLLTHLGHLIWSGRAVQTPHDHQPHLAEQKPTWSRLPRGLLLSRVEPGSPVQHGRHDLRSAAAQLGGRSWCGLLAVSGAGRSRSGYCAVRSSSVCTDSVTNVGSSSPQDYRAINLVRRSDSCTIRVARLLK